MSSLDLEYKLEVFAGDFKNLFEDELVFKNFLEAAKTADDAKFNFEASRYLSGPVVSAALLEVDNQPGYNLYRAFYIEALNHYGFDAAQCIQYLSEFKGERSIEKLTILKAARLSQVAFLFDEYEDIIKAKKQLKLQEMTIDGNESKDLSKLDSSAHPQHAKLSAEASNINIFMANSFKILLSYTLNHNSLEDSIKIIHNFYYHGWNADSSDVYLPVFRYLNVSRDISEHPKLPFTFESLLKFIKIYKDIKDIGPIHWLIEVYL